MSKDCTKEMENYRKMCLELEEKSKMDEIRCMMFEAEIEDLKKKNKDLEEQITNGENKKTDEENQSKECIQLIKAELCFWKQKAKELASQVLELESKVNIKETHESSIEANPEDGCSNKKISQSTPGVALPPSSVVIHISDEDVNYNHIPKVKTLSDGDLDEDDMDGFKFLSPIATTAKRKRCSNIITSDDEDDMKDHKGHSSKIITSDEETSDDDNAPISTLRTQHSSRLNTDSDVSRKHLTRLRKSEAKKRKAESFIDLNKTENSSSEDDVDEDSQSEDESLNGFIVESSDCESGSDDSCEESEDESNEFRETLDKIRRKKDSNVKWDLEGDMLADFGKDPEMCMRAVCVLYRQQTADEKATQGTIERNGPGFSHTDAFRASKVAEFLTDGDSNGDLNKSVEELEEYDSKGVKLCMALAAKYPKQLFEIYKNKEDPYFLHDKEVVYFVY